jgi:hypothetical protein
MIAAMSRFHLQRVLVVVSGAVLVAGLVLPWVRLAERSYNAFDHPWFRVPLVICALAIMVSAVVGDRAKRIGGMALGITVVSALVVCAIAGLVIASITSSSFYAWRLSAGGFVTIGAAVFAFVFAVLVGRPPRPPKPSVGSALSDWNRR